MVRRTAIGLVLIASAAGITWYVLAPGTGSYTVGGWLIAPGVGLTSYWLHKRLPTRVEWALAIVIAPIGPIAYLLAGGSQWWNWGQLSVVPLLLLIVSHVGVPRSHDYGGPVDGPWGPP